MPHHDAGAIGGDAGVFLPRQSGMTTGPGVSGFYEHYLTARDSLRVGVGLDEPEGRESSTPTRPGRCASAPI